MVFQTLWGMYQHSRRDRRGDGLQFPDGGLSSQLHGGKPLCAFTQSHHEVQTGSHHEHASDTRKRYTIHVWSLSKLMSRKTSTVKEMFKDELVIIYGVSKYVDGNTKRK